MGSGRLPSSWQHWAMSCEKAGSDPLKLHVHTVGTETTNWFRFLYPGSERGGSVNGERFVISAGEPAPTNVPTSLLWWAQHREHSYSAPRVIWVDRSLRGDPLCVALPAESLLAQNCLQRIALLERGWRLCVGGMVQLGMAVVQCWVLFVCWVFSFEIALFPVLSLDLK